MATKTITVDLEAYNRLVAVRGETESFSQAIKRVVRPPLDLDAFRDRIRSARLSEKAANAVEEQVRSRRKRSDRER